MYMCVYVYICILLDSHSIMIRTTFLVWSFFNTYMVNIHFKNNDYQNFLSPVNMCLLAYSPSQ